MYRSLSNLLNIKTQTFYQKSKGTNLYNNYLTNYDIAEKDMDITLVHVFYVKIRSKCPLFAYCTLFIVITYPFRLWKLCQVDCRFLDYVIIAQYKSIVELFQTVRETLRFVVNICLVFYLRLYVSNTVR